MRRVITERELQEDGGEILRRLDAGESFVVARLGVPVGELVPLHRQVFASRERVVEMFTNAAPVDRAALAANLDRVTDQDSTPRS